jgi:hypothetical protein
MGCIKMLHYILPGTTSEEINNDIINDLNAKEGNEPQELYTRLLIIKQNLKFNKPVNMGEETY